jgi:hypothetical protein
MKHAIYGDVQMVPVSSIKELPRNKTIHPDFDPYGRDSWLVENLDTHGILEPLLLKPDRTLHGGHRRIGWAKLRKIELVPCIVVKPGDDNAVYESTQMHRHMTVYAKCVLYREKLSELIKRGGDSAKKNLRLRWEHTGDAPGAGGGGAKADDNIVNQEWIRCEQVLGVSRRVLIRGVKLLDKIDELIASAVPSEIDRANRVLSIFRNQGMEPARRMLGETDAIAETDEPDCINWQDDDEADEQHATKSKKGGKSKEKAGVVKFAKKDDEPQAPWIVESLKCLGRIEELTKKHKAYSPVVQASLNAIEKEINGGSAKRAA